MKKAFKIDHLDPLGQGVSKLEERPIFIPKTLPGEEGFATIRKKSKGVIFAYINSPEDVEKKSPERINAPCPHFSLCNSCQFLHTNYESELKYKTSNLKKIIEMAKNPELIDLKIEVTPSPSRLGHRNRMQLHYDKKQKLLGSISVNNNGIIEIPNCQISTPAIQQEIKKLYDQKAWLDIVQDLPSKGHLELYYRENFSISIVANAKYAHGGFSQVNPDMDDKLKQMLKRTYEKASTNGDNPTIIDLFGGDGNLTREMINSNTYVIDEHIPENHGETKHQNFISQDIYKKDCISKLKATLPTTTDLLILDPPRSGYQNLAEFVNTFNPKKIIYVSCNPWSLIKDTSSIREWYRPTEIHLFDFFPSTRHFETVITIDRIN